MNDTIFALATAQGKAGVAVIRVSGPDACAVTETLCAAVPVPGRGVRDLCDPSGALIDQALVLTFAEGHSFTGELSVELHLHGSPAIVARVLSLLSEDVRTRQAEPGEFTRRALENGQLDLAQVEGLADVIDAETEAQRRQAMRVFSGALGEHVGRWRADLVRATALVEATIDFADEEVPIDVSPEVGSLVRGVMKEMQREIEGARAAERIRSGFEVAIVGAPNVGKSTLLNKLAGREAAITSEIAGTTRDVIEVQMNIDGLPVTLLDTAGLREAKDDIERIGIERGKDRARQADLCVVLSLDGSGGETGDIVVRAKVDEGAFDQLAVSGRTGNGVDALINAIGARLKQQAAGAGLIIRERHRVAMTKGVEGLERVLAYLSSGTVDTEIMAEELRQVLRAVDSLVGRVDVEDVLGEIFASFCIGK